LVFTTADLRANSDPEFTGNAAAEVEAESTT
jgi:hypothetical protein